MPAVTPIVNALYKRINHSSPPNTNLVPLNFTPGQPVNEKVHITSGSLLLYCLNGKKLTIC